VTIFYLLLLLSFSVLASLHRPTDTFDAMVTGDLMEYSVHGSYHGSMQSGSHHGSLHSPMGGSIHGFLTPRDNDTPIASSAANPLVKTNFRQLGKTEDGWLIEMYYKSSVSYQKSVLDLGENELTNIVKEVAKLEEERFQRLHQMMVAFVPRQRRLYVALPTHMKEILNNLVGLRIDADSLETLIDESIRDRSKNHFKRASTHRSAIMNRSRLNNAKESSEVEIDEIAKLFGDPFKGSQVLLSQMAELKPSGFAIKMLYPPNMTSAEDWVAGRKADIIKSLTPIQTLSFEKCKISSVKMHNRLIEVVEEKSAPAKGTSRFMNVVNAGAQRGRRCTLRLPSAVGATDMRTLLIKAKEAIKPKK